MLGRNTFANACFSNDNNGRNGVIRKSIAGVITLLGVLATGHSAFADTVNFSGAQVSSTWQKIFSHRFTPSSVFAITDMIAERGFNFYFYISARAR